MASAQYRICPTDALHLLLWLDHSHPYIPIIPTLSPPSWPSLSQSMQSRGVSDTYASLLTLLGRYSARPLARPPLSPKRPRWVHLWASCFGTRRPSKEEKELRQRLLALLHDEKGEEEGESKVGVMNICFSGGGRAERTIFIYLRILSSTYVHTCMYAYVLPCDGLASFSLSSFLRTRAVGGRRKGIHGCWLTCNCRLWASGRMSDCPHVSCRASPPLPTCGCRLGTATPPSMSLRGYGGSRHRGR